MAQQNENKYILNGLTVVSNDPNIIRRDDAGNVILNELGENNQLLIIEPNYYVITNKSFIDAIDTQFKYFKFPVETTSIGSTDLPDLDINFVFDPYNGQLILTADNWGKWYFIDNGKKRRFRIAAASTWAIKNKLNPFANILGTDQFKRGSSYVDPGQDNWWSNDEADKPTGYHEKSYKVVSTSVIDGYPEGPAYLPADAFPEGNVYSKFTFELQSLQELQHNNIPFVPIKIEGNHFGKAEFSSDLKMEQSNYNYRQMEFDTRKASNGSLKFTIGRTNESLSFAIEEQEVLNSFKYLGVRPRVPTKPSDLIEQKWDHYGSKDFQEYAAGFNIHIHPTAPYSGDKFLINRFLEDANGDVDDSGPLMLPGRSNGQYWLNIQNLLNDQQAWDWLFARGMVEYVGGFDGNRRFKGNIQLEFKIEFDYFDAGYTHTKYYWKWQIATNRIRLRNGSVDNFQNPKYLYHSGPMPNKLYAIENGTTVWGNMVKFGAGQWQRVHNYPVSWEKPAMQNQQGNQSGVGTP